MNRLFIHNLKKWRKIQGNSQEKLAEKCNVAHAYIRQIECGNRCPSFALIGKIADALEIEPYQLFFDEEAQGQPMRTRRLKSIQTKLLEAVSGDIQAAFDELKM